MQKAHAAMLSQLVQHFANFSAAGLGGQMATATVDAVVGRLPGTPSTPVSSSPAAPSPQDSTDDADNAALIRSVLKTALDNGSDRYVLALHGASSVPLYSLDHEFVFSSGLS